jgi:hypothetical protein
VDQFLLIATPVSSEDLFALLKDSHSLLGKYCTEEEKKRLKSKSLEEKGSQLKMSEEKKIVKILEEEQIRKVMEELK